ncbi:signal peptidase II, partial [Avibacterium volantium]
MLKKSGLAFLWLSAVVFGIDLLSKYAVVSHFALYDSVQILPIFNLTYVRNYGAAFSFLADHSGWQKTFFILLAIGISAMLCVFLAKNKA